MDRQDRWSTREYAMTAMHSSTDDPLPRRLLPKHPPLRSPPCATRSALHRRRVFHSRLVRPFPARVQTCLQSALASAATAPNSHDHLPLLCARSTSTLTPPTDAPLFPSPQHPLTSAFSPPIPSANPVHNARPTVEVSGNPANPDTTPSPRAFLPDGSSKRTTSPMTRVHCHIPDYATAAGIESQLAFDSIR